MIPVSELSLDPCNANTHHEPDLREVRASLTEFGFQKPLVVSPAGVVLCGNGVLLAAKGLGIEEVPCVVTDLEGIAAEGYALADNQLARLSKFDPEKLAEALSRCDHEGQAVPGFEDDYQLEKALGQLGGNGELLPEDDDEDLGGSSRPPKRIQCPSCGHKFTEADA